MNNDAIKNELKQITKDLLEYGKMSAGQSVMLSGTAKDWEDAEQTAERQRQAKFHAGKSAGYIRSAQVLELVLQEWNSN